MKRRRLIVTAIALERYRGRHGSYPASLQALVPELLPRLPIDFMDGQPLRYSSSSVGGFVLYSVGLDGVDNGGKMPVAGGRRDLRRAGVTARSRNEPNKPSRPAPWSSTPWKAEGMAVSCE